MKYQFCIRFDNIDANSAASKAVLDCNAIFSKLGYKDYTLTVGDNSNKLTYYPLLLKGLVTFFFGIKSNATIGIQYPLLSINSIFKYFISLARLKKAKVFCVVHDLESLRSGGTDKAEISREVENLNHYDSIIVHNQLMANWLIIHGVKKSMVVLGLFDYISDYWPLHQADYKGPIVFAGNLGKSTFIYSLDKIMKKFSVYGPNFDNGKNQRNGNVHWQGVFGPGEILKRLQGSFGLIWDGENVNSCSGNMGNYLEYNNPHKASLYVAAGLPVIAPVNSAIGAFIKRFNIGILVNSLSELDTLNISEEKYKTLQNNVMLIRKKILAGDYFADAVKSIEMQCQ